jgi:hypothetical protein
MSRLVALRLPDDLYESIDRMAKAEGIGLSKAIISMLREESEPVVEMARAKPPVAESAKPVKRESAVKVSDPKPVVVNSEECPHGYPSKKHCNFHAGGCAAW